MRVEKICKNCDNKPVCKNKNKDDCRDFVVMAELHEIAHECGTKIVIVPPSDENRTTIRNNFLYRTEVEDWADHHKNIWRLRLKIETSEWDEVKKYFKYYKNRNLTGWGTTSPIQVSEILTLLRGDEETKENLKHINHKIENVEDETDLLKLNKEKRELLGVIF